MKISEQPELYKNFDCTGTDARSIQNRMEVTLAKAKAKQKRAKKKSKVTQLRKRK